MKVRRLDILVIVAAALSLMNCSKNELLTSFEEEQEQSMSSLPLQLPLQFTPYVGDRTEATTRADLNYLSNITDRNTEYTSGKWVFKSFPWYRSDPEFPNDPDKGTGSARGARGDYDHFRFGKLGNNSYIVGVYGYYGLNNDVPMTWNTMTNNTNLSSLSSNFMTNQPLLHVDSLTWTYNPLRYWPNNNNDVKVTFVSYYPFQDYPESGRGYNSTTGVTGYYRDGKNVNEEIDPRYVDFSDCIVPPAKDAKGEDAYTFTFTQKDNLEEQIDFLLGINKDVTKQDVNGNPSIDLQLKHTMCAVVFDLRAPAFSLPAGTEVLYEINSIRLEGLYNKGKVYPEVNSKDFDIKWKELEGNVNYTLTFDDSDNFYGTFTRPSFNGDAEKRYARQLIYENTDTKSKGLPSTYSSAAKKNSNSRGMKYMMMVIPQKVDVSSDGVTPKKAYLVVNYDIKYKYSDEVINIFKNNEERILLSDQAKQDNVTKGQLFIAGKYLTFNLRFTGPKTIEMDAELMDWDEGEGPEEEGGNGVPVPHEWEDQMDREEEGGTP